MSSQWPVEYRVMALRAVPINAEPREVMTVRAAEPSQRWETPGVPRGFWGDRERRPGVWSPVAASDVDRVIVDDLRARWPDGAVDLFSALACYTEAYKVQGRYSVDGAWVSLEPGFKEDQQPVPQEGRVSAPGRPRFSTQELDKAARVDQLRADGMTVKEALLEVGLSRQKYKARKARRRELGLE